MVIKSKLYSMCSQFLKMNGPRLPRNLSIKTYLTLLMLACVCTLFLVFVVQSKQKYDDIKLKGDVCQRTQEAMAAQLQVIFEYKMRLEKSVQEEKSEHRRTREDLQNQLEEERAKRSKEVLEATNKLASLQQHYKLLQGQHEDLNEDYSKARALTDKQIEEYKIEIKQLKLDNSKAMKKAADALSQAADMAIVNLKSKNVGLEEELKKLKKELQNCKRIPGLSSTAKGSPANEHHLGNVLNLPKVPLLSSSSSAPNGQSNSPLPVPGPPDTGDKPLKVRNDKVQVPPGVVPAPPNEIQNYNEGEAQPYRRYHDAIEESNRAVEMDDHFNKDKKSWREVNEGEEGEHRDELQLEDADDEEEDDVDQIDYGNEVVAQKPDKHIPVAAVKPHESIMVNPK